MKKHQLAAMVLSALSAGILISCSKSNEDSASTESEVAETSGENATTSKDIADTISAENIQAIDLSELEMQAYLADVIDNHIMPAYQNVADESGKLNDLASEYCQSGSVDATNLQLLREQWLSLATAWSAAEMINFGPAMDSMSNLYINYFPDERGLVHKGVSNLIAENPNLTAEQLASESAIVQGIPGLEEVLFANDTLNAGQCQYVMSASSALHNRLSDVQKQWQQSASQLLSTGGEFKDEVGFVNNIGLTRWINSLLSMLETTKSVAIDKPLGLTGGQKGHVPAATAQQSRAIITAKVEALNTVLTDPVLVKILADNGHSSLNDEISRSLADTTTLLAQLPEDISTATPEQQQALYDKLTVLTRIIKRKLMPTLDIQVGFNSTDGD